MHLEDASNNRQMFVVVLDVDDYDDDGNIHAVVAEWQLKLQLLEEVDVIYQMAVRMLNS